MVQLALLITLGQNVLLYGFLTDQAVDVDLPSLTYAVTSVLCLQCSPHRLDKPFC